jgi:methyl-accepting chemotaxis protein
METMAKLKERIEAIARQIMTLSEQTTQIDKVSSLVGDLANQTNMLALNAAVEASRAGESGKGFGVVATEIRKLADESKKSAAKINTLITDVQSAMNSTVMVTDEGTKTADASIQLARETVNAFLGVSEAVNSVFSNSYDISQSAKQQAVAVQEVVAAINALNLGAQETTDSIAQVRNSTDELNEAARQLEAVI